MMRIGMVNHPSQRQLLSAGLISLLIAAALTFSNFPFLFSQLWSNIAWRSLSISVVRSISPSSALFHFEQAIFTDPDNLNPYRGAGMAAAEALDEPSALRYWMQGDVKRDMLNQMGRQYRDRGQLDIAFIYFRGAARLDASPGAEGEFLAGKLCQSLRAEPQVVSLDNQRYCDNFFAAQNDNLLLDGQFDHLLEFGWSGTFFFKDPDRARVEIDPTTGAPAPSLKLSGFTEGRHAGVYQRIAIRPGATVHFSGYFRVESAGDLATPLLYVEWQDQGKVHGASFYKAEANLDWTYLEGTITLPITSEPWMNFYPALLIGRGVVWSDDVSVKILD